MSAPATVTLRLTLTADELDVIASDLLRAADECYTQAGKLNTAGAISKKCERGDLRFELARRIREAAMGGRPVCCVAAGGVVRWPFGREAACSLHPQPASDPCPTVLMQQPPPAPLPAGAAGEECGITAVHYHIHRVGREFITTKCGGTRPPATPAASPAEEEWPRDACQRRCPTCKGRCLQPPGHGTAACLFHPGHPCPAEESPAVATEDPAMRAGSAIGARSYALGLNRPMSSVLREEAIATIRSAYAAQTAELERLRAESERLKDSAALVREGRERWRVLAEQRTRELVDLQRQLTEAKAEVDRTAAIIGQHILDNAAQRQMIADLTLKMASVERNAVFNFILMARKREAEAPLPPKSPFEQAVIDEFRARYGEPT